MGKQRKRKKDITQTGEELYQIQKESEEQRLPEQKAVFSVSSKIRKRVRNLPDPTRPPLGYDEHKAFDRVFPYIRLPRLHPPGHGDTVIFNASELPADQLILGDNLEILRTLPSNFIDLIYIDPPFFSGRQYNVIWGDTNEVRTFYDIWEGGIDSYIIWLNARLWEMRRVLKPTGSIYVHCDWHAGHYIKTEMDKIFGYENFINEIVWHYRRWTGESKAFLKMHDIILLYAKSSNYYFKPQYTSYTGESLFRKQHFHTRIKGDDVYVTKVDEKGVKAHDFFEVDDIEDISEIERILKNERLSSLVTKYFNHIRNYATDLKLSKKSIKELENIEKTVKSEYGDSLFISLINSQASERIGYPTQKPEALLERIIESSTKEGDVVADFFCGGGTTLAVAMKNKRRFIGCDSSRVAISVTLDRLVKIGEEMSGVKSNISTQQIEVSLKRDLFSKEVFQLKLQAEGVTERVPNIEVSYHGVYPIDKFKGLDQESFIKFVLTCYGASRNTAEGITHGYRPPRQQEPILVGSPDPAESIDAQNVKNFFDEIKSRLEPNKLVHAKIIGWRFSRQVVEYTKILRRYIEENNLPMEIELIPLDSKEFRARILQRFPDTEESEFFLRFSKSPVIGDLRIRKKGPPEYEFEAVDALSTNEDGYLVNCQWDFDYQEGHFAADKDYILSRKKIKPKGQSERFEAILTAKHKFDKEGEYTIACKVQDNLAGEAILAKSIKVEG